MDLDSPSGLGGEEEEEEEACPAFSQPGGGRVGGHTCEECLKTFASPGKLRQHEYSHTGETPFECGIQGPVEALILYLLNIGRYNPGGVLKKRKSKIFEGGGKE